MCGICGLATKNLRPDELELTVARMTRTLRHRGPDGEGTRLFKSSSDSSSIAFGHTRLAIIDLSQMALQPLANEDESVWVSINGEIFNYRELRAELEQRGHRFRSNSDCEVVVHLYEEEGIKCVERLNGMFALALIDRPRQKLLLARDPIGVKPLYYSSLPGNFLFGSEIKAILAANILPVDVNWQAAFDYLTYLYVPCPQTMFKGIEQLPPAHRLLLDLKSGSVQLEKYWRVKDLPEIRSTSPSDLRDQARSLVTDSVHGQLMSDVPLGIFLSGGIDSSIVAGLARQEDASLQSYTVLFEGEDLAAYNEQETSRAASRHLNLAHHELRVGSVAPEEILNLVEYFDQPFGNPTSYLMYQICKHARDHIKVALCGAGGDELYAGYPRYRAAEIAARLRWIPRSLLRAGGNALGVFRDSFQTMSLRRARKFLDGLDENPVSQFVRWTYFLNDDEKRSLLHSEKSANGKSQSLSHSDRIFSDALDRSALSDTRNRYLHADVQTFLADNILEYTDKMSMAVPLEVRVPLLDHRFVEFSLNVPFNHKLNRGQSKLLLRDTFADLLAPEVLHGPKRGFNVPLALWMNETFDTYFDNDPRAHARWGEDAGTTWRDGIFDANFIQRLRVEHRRGRQDHSYPLFGLMMFDVWWRKYVKSSLPLAHSQS
jgi:asparagine synthase (glutamine-hydrolysing)